MRRIEQISVSLAERERLEPLVRDRNTPQKPVWRGRIVLLASHGTDGGGGSGGRGQEPAHGPPLASPLCGEGTDGLLKDATCP